MTRYKKRVMGGQWPKQKTYLLQVKELTTKHGNQVKFWTVEYQGKQSKLSRFTNDRDGSEATLAFFLQTGIRPYISIGMIVIYQGRKYSVNCQPFQKEGQAVHSRIKIRSITGKRDEIEVSLGRISWPSYYMKPEEENNG